MPADEKPPWETPWGTERDEPDKYFGGFWWVHTSRHGGLYLTPEQQEVIPESLKVYSKNETGEWWEENTAWSLPVICLLSKRPESSLSEAEREVLHQAHDTAQEEYPDEWEQLTGRELSRNDEREEARHEDGQTMNDPKTESEFGRPEAGIPEASKPWMLSQRDRPPEPGQETPVGRVRETGEEHEMPGMWHVTFEGHKPNRGLYLSPERRAAIPDSVKKYAADPDGALWGRFVWSMAIVSLFEDRPKESLTGYERMLLEGAEATAKDRFPAEWQRITGQKVLPEASKKLDGETEPSALEKAQSESEPGAAEASRLTSESRAEVPQFGTRRTQDRELDDIIKQQDEKQKAKDQERVPERHGPNRER